MPEKQCISPWRCHHLDAPWFWGTVNKTQESSFPWWRSARGDRSWWGWGWGEQPKYVGFGVTAMAATLKANLGALFIYQQQNKSNKHCRNLLKHLLSLCKEQLMLGSRCGARSHPAVWRTPRCPGSCNRRTAQTLPQDSLLKSGEGQGSRCRQPSPLWLPLNHTFQKELNPRAHKNTSETHFFPFEVHQISLNTKHFP